LPEGGVGNSWPMVGLLAAAGVAILAGWLLHRIQRGAPD
jgi:hypothetical protein